jgi:hypothetical protein
MASWIFVLVHGDIKSADEQDMIFDVTNQAKQYGSVTSRVTNGSSEFTMPSKVWAEKLQDYVEEEVLTPIFWQWEIRLGDIPQTTAEPIQPNMRSPRRRKAS